MLTSSLKSGQIGKGFHGLEGGLELLESNDVEEGHEDLSILSSNDVGLSLELDGLLLEHATESALGFLHDVDVIGNLELGLNIGEENVVLVGGLVEVEKDLD